jgi:hypothetical protein
VSAAAPAPEPPKPTSAPVARVDATTAPSRRSRSALRGFDAATVTSAPSAPRLRDRTARGPAPTPSPRLRPRSAATRSAPRSGGPPRSALGRLRPRHRASAPALERRAARAPRVPRRCTWETRAGRASHRDRPIGAARHRAALGCRGARCGGMSVARLAPGGGGEGNGPNGAIPPEYEAYVRALRQRVQERLVYPWTAVRRGQQGVDRGRAARRGRRQAARRRGGRGPERRRAPCGRGVGRARRRPVPVPAGMPPRPLVIRLPVEFRLR